MSARHRRKYNEVSVNGLDFGHQRAARRMKRIQEQGRILAARRAKTMEAARKAKEQVIK